MHVGFIQQSDKVEFAEESRASNNTVIPNQSSDWCGNLHRIPGSLSSYRLFYPAVFSEFIHAKLCFYPGDCHTSDVGHWFAMTGKSGSQ